MQHDNTEKSVLFYIGNQHNYSNFLGGKFIVFLGLRACKNGIKSHKIPISSFKNLSFFSRLAMLNKHFVEFDSVSKIILLSNSTKKNYFGYTETIKTNKLFQSIICITNKKENKRNKRSYSIFNFTKYIESVLEL